MRTTRATTLTVALILAANLAPCAGGAIAITFRNAPAIAASTTDQNGASFTITGLSGIAYRTGSEFLGVMDNSNKLVRLNITFASDATITTATVIGGLTLALSRDFEGIAYTGPVRNSVLLSEETTPAILEFSLTDGSLIRTISPPPIFSNIRPNFGFESLSLRVSSIGSGLLWTANEEALTPDGPLSTQSAGTELRLLRFALSEWTPTPSFQGVYLTQPWHGSQLQNAARSGVSDLVALPGTPPGSPAGQSLLVLERSFAFNLGGLFQNRIYEVSTAGATDVSGLTSGLVGQSYIRATKNLLWTGNTIGNFEGLCLGHALSQGGGGGYALVGITDNGGTGGSNTLVALQITGIPGPVSPCPTDASGDDQRTPADIFAYLNAYFSANPGTDFNADSVRTPADIFAFLNAYFAGC